MAIDGTLAIDKGGIDDVRPDGAARLLAMAAAGGRLCVQRSALAEHLL